MRRLHAALFVIIAVLTLCGGAPAYPALAEGRAPPPLPPRKADALRNLQATLKEKQADETRLAAEVEAAQKDLRATRTALTEMAALARKNEQDLLALETRIADLSAEQADLTKRLEADYGSMADLILALERLRRVPPEALIVRPGAPLQTAQTAMLLQSVLPAIDRRADRLATDLRRLREIGDRLDADRAAVLSTKTELGNKYNEIKELASRRERLYRNLNNDYRETAAAAERIAREAQTMQDFMARLAAENRAAEERRTAAARAAREAQRHAQREARQNATASRAEKAAAVRAARNTDLAAFAPEEIPRPGRPRLPVAGMVLSAFGQKDLIGAVSQGMTIESRSGSLALAPIGGVVRYAGHFKNYGQMVILEHKDGYHSLIGGLDEAGVSVGQSLEAGEPLGKLPSSSSRGGNPALYYELRHKGRPVNPAEKFPDLRS